MSGLTAKIVSTWLNETDERGLQAAFCYLLISRGFRIIHSTSHGAMEMGKDIIATGPDGSLHAYQLKAHHDGHIGMSTYRDTIQAQVRDLCDNAVVYPGVEARVPNHAYIVANSDFHEHVQREVDDFNRGQERRNGTQLALVGRTQLLSDFIALSESLLPDDVASSKAVLQLLLDDGRGEFPISLFAPVLEDLFTRMAGQNGTASKRRVFAQAALITEVVVGPWRKKQNHWAVFQAYGTCLMAGTMGWTLAGEDVDLLPCLDAISGFIVGILIDFTNECHQFTVRDIVLSNEYDHIGRAKLTHVMGLVSLAAILDTADSPVISRDVVQKALDVIRRHSSHRFIWGEPAIPQVLCIALLLEREATGREADDFWSWAVRNAISSCSSDGCHYFPPWETLTAENARRLLGLSTISTRRSDGGYWFDPMVRIAVRLNLKSLVKTSWPLAVTMGIHRFKPDKPADFFRYHNEKGTNEIILRPVPVRWPTLVSEVRSLPQPRGIFALRPYWYLIQAMVYPHRVDGDLLVALLPRFARGCWY